MRTDFFEDGILGLELSPDFDTNGLLYVYHVHPNGTSRVVRLRDQNGSGSQETIILDGLPAGTNHLGSKLRIGPDGFLYVSIGDSNLPGVQDVNTLEGKLLRVRSHNGSIPGSNPFPGSRTWALGFRNPFGFDFHPDTGDIWLTDNGPNVHDELNVVRIGENFGWDGNNSSMGPQNDACCVDPIWSSGSNQSAPTELTFASANTAYGAEFVWNAFFANNNTGEVTRVVPGGDDLDEVASLSAAFTGGLGSLVALVEGPDGYLYVSRTNSIHRLELTNP